jgi:hypothetical protein
MKTSYGAYNDEVLLIPVDPEADQYGATATGASDSSAATGASDSSDAIGATGSSDTSGATGSSYGHEESSLMRFPELNGYVQSTRYVKFFTLVAVVAALLGSIMYLTSSVRGNFSKRPSMDKESYSDASFARYSSAGLPNGPATRSLQSVKINLGGCLPFAIVAESAASFTLALTVIHSGSIGNSPGMAIYF